MKVGVNQKQTIFLLPPNVMMLVKQGFLCAATQKANSNI